MKQTWYKKYLPKDRNEYVFKDANQKSLVDKWISDGIFPDILLSGVQGSGKTSLAWVLINELNIEPADTLFINASKDNGIEYIREKISNFISMSPYGDFRCVVLDEADRLSANAQDALRGIMGNHSSEARFILTCNHPERIIPALHSRLQTLVFDKLDPVEFKVRVAQILLKENISFEIEVLTHYVDQTYPDMRKCINLCEQNSHTGTLLIAEDSGDDSTDYRHAMIDLFKKGKYREARELICKQISPDGYDDLYKFLYRNLDLWADTEDQKDEAILIIRDAMVNGISCDPEINLSATIVELSNVRQ